MERELKAKLDEAISIAVKRFMVARNGGPQDPADLERDRVHTRKEGVHTRDFRVETRIPLRKTQDAVAKNAKPDPYADHVEFVRRKLWQTASWKAVQEELVKTAIVEMIDNGVAKLDRAAIDAAQMTLPGFDLPKRVGSTPIATTTLKAFFLHMERYRKSSKRKDDKLAAMEHVAQGVSTIYAKDTEMLLADAIKQAGIEPLKKPFLVKSAAAK